MWQRRHDSAQSSIKSGACAFRLYARRNMLLLTNKDTSATHSVALTFAQAQHGAWTLYGFDAANGLRSIASGSHPARP